MFLLVSVILFTGGSALVHAGISHPPTREAGTSLPGKQASPQEAGTPGKQTPHPRHTVNERPVRILLECIIVFPYLYSTSQLLNTESQSNDVITNQVPCTFCEEIVSMTMSVSGDVILKVTLDYSHGNAIVIWPPGRHGYRKQLLIGCVLISWRDL